MDKKQITRRSLLKSAPATVAPILLGTAATPHAKERTKSQEFVALAPTPEVMKAHFAANETNKLPLRELLESMPNDLVPLEQFIEDELGSSLLEHISEDAIIDALETVLEYRKRRRAS